MLAMPHSMMAHSPSAPTISLVNSLGQQQQSQPKKHRPACPCLLKGTLFISSTAGRSALSGWHEHAEAHEEALSVVDGEGRTWLPFAVTHHRDGSVLLRPCASVAEVRGAPSASSQAAELTLGADWRRPFVAASQRMVECSAQISKKSAPPGEGTAEAEEEGKVRSVLYPFSLNYTVAGGPSTVGTMEVEAKRRRTLLMAAATEKERNKWLMSFKQKSHMPELREGAALPTPLDRRRFAALGEGLTRSHASVLGLTITADKLRTSTAGSGSQGRQTASRSSGRQPRLDTAERSGHPGLWNTQTHLRCVRDLYDGYSSDPVGKCSAIVLRSPDGEVRPQTTEGQSNSLALRSYVRRQVQIEQLLHEQIATLFNKSTVKKKPKQEDPTAGIDSSLVAEASPCPALVASSGSSIHLADMTPNIVIEDDILSCVDSRGGAVFLPKTEGSFRISLCPLDPFGSHPIYLCLVDAAEVGIFTRPEWDFLSSSHGIFLCPDTGTTATAVLETLAGGEDRCIVVEYTCSTPGPQECSGGDGRKGRLRFYVQGPDGAEVPIEGYRGPRLDRTVEARQWRPCLVLCTAGTRMRVADLS
mmetsp:Transcript_63514/g.151448  ORF Transcript_63514/g.151448 Transcript_63514/m.151448 type:complete len:587 (+) Transcript_63514:143-1903(+)|eukprot:CAMPEP_0178392338 /NCGR_PEP_ID=MMETSP0689_2-20121128/11628_1 /TAXON_ID=160604 /ORGANISM="Amphidinium massartii, Strain CS-259" /LENGTH=586 /DNA_ID=CAMNT_0020012911 /DNA_START=55 /DNA_END=1815 /DNA_ORIENTATION=+